METRVRQHRRRTPGGEITEVEQHTRNCQERRERLKLSGNSPAEQEVKGKPAEE